MFTECRMDYVDLSDADLRRARFDSVTFDPGPGSRAGHTEPDARWHPMYGSQSGFYSEDVAASLWGDPDQLRLADLRGADLRGAVFASTSLFRVDLRGATLDDETRALARSHGAFVD